MFKIELNLLVQDREIQSGSGSIGVAVAAPQELATGLGWPGEVWRRRLVSYP